MCTTGDRGQLVSHEQVARYPTSESVQAYFDEWIAFYQDYYLFPDITVSFEYGFDSYKVGYSPLTRRCGSVDGRAGDRHRDDLRAPPRLARCRRWPICTARRSRSMTPPRIRTSSVNSVRQERASTARLPTQYSPVAASSMSPPTTSGSETPRYRGIDTSTRQRGVGHRRPARRVAGGARHAADRARREALHLRVLAGRTLGARPAPRAARYGSRRCGHSHCPAPCRTSSSGCWTCSPTAAPPGAPLRHVPPARLRRHLRRLQRDVGDLRTALQLDRRGPVRHAPLLRRRLRCPRYPRPRKRSSTQTSSPS